MALSSWQVTSWIIIESKNVFFLSRLASATSVVDALIGVFASTREAREGREKIFFSFQYLCQLVVFGCHSTCSASCIKWFIPANWVFQRWCVEFSSRVVSARDNSWQTTRAKLLVWMLSFHWRPIMSQAVNITVFIVFSFFVLSRKNQQNKVWKSWARCCRRLAESYLDVGTAIPNVFVNNILCKLKTIFIFQRLCRRTMPSYAFLCVETIKLYGQLQKFHVFWRRLFLAEKCFPIVRVIEPLENKAKRRILPSLTRHGYFIR